MLSELFGEIDDDYDSGAGDDTKVSRPEDPRSWNAGFVGLQNLGSTCYLNSLLQTMYMTAPFRARILQLTDEELGASILDTIDEEEAEQARQEAEAKRAGTTVVKEEVIDGFKDDPAYEGVLEQLKGFGANEYAINMAIRSRNGDLGNVDAICDFAFSYELPDDWEKRWQTEQDERAQRLQAKEDAATAAAAASGSPATAVTNKRRGYRVIPLRLRQFFAQLQLLNQKSISTQQLTRSFGWKDNNLGVQQDVVELNNVLFDAVHRSLKGTSDDQLISSLYEMDIVTKITCQNCGRTSERVTKDPLLWAQVRGCNALDESLASYVTPETLSAATDNAYECADCHENGLGKQTALMGPSIRRLPEVLQIALSRFNYSFANGAPTRNKINSVVAFPLVLDMAPYLEEEVAHRIEAEKQRREAAKQAWLERQQQRQQEEEEQQQQSAATVPETTTTTATSETPASSEEAPASTPASGTQANTDGLSRRQRAKLNKERQEQQQQAKKEAKEAKDKAASSQKNEQPELPLLISMPDLNENSTELYDLLSVVVHSGGAHGGHYWAYICDRYQSAGEVDDSASEQPERQPISAPIISSASSSSSSPSCCAEETAAASAAAASTSSSQPVADVDTSKLGRWYEFNDSRVSRIDVKTLTHVYGGRSSSAYMLIYVRRNPARPTALPPVVPANLEARYLQQNKQLDIDREIYAREIAKIRIKVFTLNLFKKDESTGRLFLRSRLEPPEPAAKPADENDSGEKQKPADDEAGEDEEDGIGLPMMGAGGEDEDEDEDEDEGELGIFGALQDLEDLNSGKQEPEKEYTLEDGCFTIRIDHGTTLKNFLPLAAKALANSPACPGDDYRIDPMTLDSLSGRVVVSPALSGLSNAEIRDADRTLESLGLCNGSALLLWAGNEVDLSTFLNLNILHYPPLAADATKVPLPFEHKLRVRDSATILDLKKELADLVGVPADQQFLCKVDSHVRDLAGDEKLLEDLGVRDGATVSVELLVRGDDKKHTPISLAKRAFDEAENQLVITVINRASDVKPYPSATFECNPDESLRELKVRLFSFFEPFPDPALRVGNLVLHWNDDGEAGMAMFDESRSLRGHSMSDGGIFHLTTAKQSDERQVTFKYVLRLIDDDEDLLEVRKTQTFTVSLPMNTSLADAKECMIRTASPTVPTIAGRSFRLRRTNWNQELLAILSDEKKSLDDCEVYEDTILCLEEGRVPQPGDLTCWLQVHSFIPPHLALPLIDRSLVVHQTQLAAARQQSEADKPATQASSSASTSSPSSSSSSSSEGASSSSSSSSNDAPNTEVVADADKPLPCLDSSAPSCSTADEELASAAALIPLSVYSPSLYRPKRELDVEDIPDAIFFRGFLPLTVNQSQSVADLKREYLTTMQSGAFPRESMFAGADGSVDDRWNNHLARELLQGVDDPALLRLWSGTRLVTKDNLSLKKSGIGNGSVVSAQILKKPDDLNPQTDTLLWVYKFETNPESNPGDFHWLGELVFSTGDPTLTRLRQQIHAQAEGRFARDPANLQVAKYFFNQKRWVLLAEQMGEKKPEPPSDAKMSEKARERAEQRRAQELFNLRKNDCKLAHGDILIVFESPVDAEINLSTFFPAFLDCPRLPQKREPKRNELRDSYERWGFAGSVGGGRNRPEEGIFILVDETQFLLDDE